MRNVVLGFGFAPTDNNTLTSKGMGPLRRVIVPIVSRDSSSVPACDVIVGELPTAAMSRGFLAQVGIDIHPDDWHLFHTQIFEDRVMMFYVVELTNAEIQIGRNFLGYDEVELVVNSIGANKFFMEHKHELPSAPYDFEPLLHSAWAFLSRPERPAVRYPHGFVESPKNKPVITGQGV